MHQRGGLAAYKRHLIVEYIEANLDSLIRMEPLYEIANLSKSHFHKAFLATFECTPTSYINRKRVEATCHLLEESDRPLSQIALKCGYADFPHFCRRFRKVTGMTPRTWRMEYGHLG